MQLVSLIASLVLFSAAQDVPTLRPSTTRRVTLPPGNILGTPGPTFPTRTTVLTPAPSGVQTKPAPTTLATRPAGNTWVPGLPVTRPRPQTSAAERAIKVGRDADSKQPNLVDPKQAKKVQQIAKRAADH
eukprot:Gregarina_sp_Poly_1__10192@NODE_701_length_6683_cov_481_479897_g529_i0_p5_GENE_NODE_701_length_6683_cov_481_479897_g529_i0NODE_701_length_6683_cov_481_479897_g529_i0_p5_ORF_typecomplete_len130_score11_84_NODE_701_length_6683_cov_481_479897_g529_i052035592